MRADPDVNACRVSTLCFIVIVEAILPGLVAIGVVFELIDITVDNSKHKFEIAMMLSQHIPTSCPAGAHESYSEGLVANPHH